ncbi:MAG TPA: hypothetical protein VF449_10030 [Parvibaculum sp.]
MDAGCIEGRQVADHLWLDPGGLIPVGDTTGDVFVYVSVSA